MVSVSASKAGPWSPGTWPVLRHYDGEHLLRIALPLGGIGTGTVSLGGRGELKDWEIMNRPMRGFAATSISPNNDAPFFAIHLRPRNGPTITRALLGPLDPTEYEAEDGRPANHHGLPRFRAAEFDASYPFGQVRLSDPTLPVTVRLKAFNPLIPGDADSSGLPVAVLCYEVINESAQDLTVSVCGSLRNFIGEDHLSNRISWRGESVWTGAKQNQNEFRSDGKIRGIYFTSHGVAPTGPAWGTMALVTEESEGVSYRTNSGTNAWSRAILNFWDDFSANGELSDTDHCEDDDPMASLAVSKQVPAHQTRSFAFLLTWDFPNRRSWRPDSPDYGEDTVGNYYSTRFRDAWDVAELVAPRLAELELESRRFVEALISSDYPSELKEAALFNLATLRSQTVFRIATGQLMAWEGTMAQAGSCFGSCTHVWNYESATAFLFPDLARTMRDVEFGAATDAAGKMSFRTMLPLSKAQDWNRAAADGQMGTIIKFYREWQLCGDRAFLDRHWPKVKAALAYAWVPDGWDADQDGVMEGEQPSTMDVAYYGPNPQMQFWYLGALRAAEQMALAEQDTKLADRCHALFDSGKAWTDRYLFNGEYYEQIITDPKTHTFREWAPSDELPPYQLGKGCLVDQLVGQSLSSLCQLGELAPAEHLQATLHSIMRYNFKGSFADHFNNMRSFVLGDEAGLVMASWPRGRLKVPFPYFSEAMTGFEYTAAVGMIQAGQDDDAIKVIHAIRSRFDGRKRNPFDEPECGFHYGRSLASWNALLAWSGFWYSAVDRTVSFHARPGRYFWSNGVAWGTAEFLPGQLRLTSLHGSLVADQVLVDGKAVVLPSSTVAAGATVSLALPTP